MNGADVLLAIIGGCIGGMIYTGVRDRLIDHWAEGRNWRGKHKGQNG
jgi:hypothetical protein